MMSSLTCIDRFSFRLLPQALSSRISPIRLFIARGSIALAFVHGLIDASCVRSFEKSGVPWGPPPPPHVGAMLKGRLALRALGGKDGEMLAAKVC